MTGSISASTLQWGHLSEVMANFIDAWETNAAPPTIADYLAAQPTCFGEVVRVELIKIDMEKRFARGESVRLERYLNEFPEILVAGNPPCDLIYEEFHIRRQAGEEPTPSEYYARFPQCKSALARLLNCGHPVETTSLAEKLPPVGFNVGETIDDFTLVAALGSGAFASVFLARQLSMQRLVALKISNKKSNEPETLAQLEHPHIVRVFDQRQVPERKLTLLYMQFAPGGTLRDVIELAQRVPISERSGSLVVQSVDRASEKAGYPASENSSLRRRLSAAAWPQVVCRIGAQLAMALDFAHKRGVLHRDVKPANVLLTAEYTPKLADFNTSFGSQLQGATPGAFFGGSLAYMSPEQLEAFNPEHDRLPDSLDGRSDIFSLAAMLWEMLYGQRPFREDELSDRWTKLLAQFVERRQKEKPVPPERSKDKLQTELTQVLLRAMEPDPADRPQDGAEFARELLLCLAPKSKFLVEIPRDGWRRLVRAFPLISIIVVVLLPNALGALFNYIYLRNQLESLGEPVLKAYGQVAFVLNVVYFSLGAVVAWMIVAPLARGVTLSTQPGKLSADEALQVRLRSLRFGDLAAVIGITLWVTSGIAFPLGIQALTGALDKWQQYSDFFAAMTICGLISAAYPFFLLTFVVVRVFYPALLRVAPGTDADEVALVKLENKLFKYLFAAGIVPLASMLMVVLMNVQNRYVILGLIISALAGLAVTYALYQKIREDIGALLVTVRPLEKLGSDTESRSTY